MYPYAAHRLRQLLLYERRHIRGTKTSGARPGRVAASRNSSHKFGLVSLGLNGAGGGVTGASPIRRLGRQVVTQLASNEDAVAHSDNNNLGRVSKTDISEGFAGKRDAEEGLEVLIIPTTGHLRQPAANEPPYVAQHDIAEYLRTPGATVYRVGDGLLIGDLTELTIRLPNLDTSASTEWFRFSDFGT